MNAFVLRLLPEIIARTASDRMVRIISYVKKIKRITVDARA